MALKGGTKNAAVFLSLTVALTLLFYLLAYYFLTGFEATPAVMSLFAAIAGALVWLSQIVFRKTRSGHDGPVVLLIFASSLAAALLYTATANALAPIQPAEGNGSSDSQGSSTVCQLNSGPRAGTTYRLTTALRVGMQCEDRRAAPELLLHSTASKDTSSTITRRAPIKTQCRLPPRQTAATLVLQRERRH